MTWPSEPCGRCLHDVNDHEEIEEEDIAGGCDLCGCDGFITKTTRTEAKYEREWTAVGEQAGAARAGETMWSGPYLKPGERVTVAPKSRLEAAETTVKKLREDYNRASEIAAEERGWVDKERARAIEAERERDAQTALANERVTTIFELHNQLEERRSRATVLGQALREFGSHHFNCRVVTDKGKMSGRPCTRGFFAALSDSDSNTMRPEDIQIDTYSNEVEASIRVTHKPTGIVVKREVGRNESRLQAREDALRELRAKISDSNTEGER